MHILNYIFMLPGSCFILVLYHCIKFKIPCSYLICTLLLDTQIHIILSKTVHMYVCIPRFVVFMMLQGPLGCQSLSGFSTGETLLHRDIDLFISDDQHAEINAMSWEATIQRHIEEELYNSLLEV